MLMHRRGSRVVRCCHWASSRQIGLGRRNDTKVEETNGKPSLRIGSKSGGKLYDPFKTQCQMDFGREIKGELLRSGGFVLVPVDV